MLITILVPVRGDGMAPTKLRHAAAMALRHKAHLRVVHCRTRPEDLVPHGVRMPDFARRTMLSQASELSNRQEEHLREMLHGFAETFGLDEGAARPGEAATCEFIEESGKMPDVVRQHGRLADLIVLAKPQRESNLGQSSLKSALYGAGRPVLICPNVDPDPDLGRHVAIGWNGSLPASRAVASTLSIVRAADEVTLLAGGKGQPHGATTADLEDYYRLRGIATRTLRFEAKQPATALLDKAREASASLLITGAYSHSHETEMLFGGNTQKILDETKMAVVMAH